MWQTYNIINAEYPAALQVLILIFIAALVFIVGSACYEIFETRKEERMKPLSVYLLWKLLGGPFLVDPAFWVKLLIATYIAQVSTQSSGFELADTPVESL